VYIKKTNTIFFRSFLLTVSDVSINQTFISRSNSVVFREKILNKLLVLATSQDHQNDKKLVRKARHRYERPSELRADMNIKHHRAHDQSTLINIFFM